MVNQYILPLQNMFQNTTLQGNIPNKLVCLKKGSYKTIHVGKRFLKSSRTNIDRRQGDGQPR